MKQLSYKIIPIINTRVLYVSNSVQLSVRNTVADKCVRKVAETFFNMTWTIRNKL